MLDDGVNSESQMGPRPGEPEVRDPGPEESRGSLTPAEINPTEMSTGAWGRLIWGKGARGALERIGLRNATELRALDLDVKIATDLRDFYLRMMAEGRGGATAGARETLLNDIIRVLKEAE